jgi:hypothetical protein
MANNDNNNTIIINNNMACLLIVMYLIIICESMRTCEKYNNIWNICMSGLSS